MKTKLLFSEKNQQRFYSVLALSLFMNFGFAQQVIGEFPTMDGGLEGQTATTTVPSIGSTGTPSETIWSVSSTSNSSVRTISDVPADARSGNFSFALAIAQTKTNTRLQAPTPVSPLFQVSTEYTIQFHYKTDTDPGSFLDGGIYLNSTSGGVASDITNAVPFAPNTWTKGYSTITSGSTFNNLNWAVARLSTPTADEYLATVNFDDFVVYAGPYDETAPTAVTTASAYYTENAGTSTISWTAPANAADATNGLVGGGYVVVRYASMPAADNDPNQNGIYAIGNTTTNGTASLEGTVVYIGTNTTFDETYVSGSYYKIYAVDKAFNYSEEVTVADSALSVAQNEISNLRVYPNPANDVLFIESNNQLIDVVSIYSLEGKEVLNINKVQNSVDVSSLTSGIYIIKITSNENVLTRKIIIE